MRLIVGLGNVGFRFEKTRHNTGFMVLNDFAKEHFVNFKSSKLNALIGTCRIHGEKVFLAKPTTFMNMSGQAVEPIMHYYHIPLDSLVVVYDDMDIPVGRIRLKHKGSAGGHNGIKSIIRSLGTNKFRRIRVGTSHPKYMATDDYVTSPFTKAQLPKFKKAKSRAVKALDQWTIGVSFRNLENQFN